MTTPAHRTPRTRRAFLGAGAAFAALTLAACGGNVGGGGATTAPTSRPAP